MKTKTAPKTVARRGLAGISRRQLNISNFPVKLKKDLEFWAGEHNRSVSAEATTMIQEMVAIKKLTAANAK